MPLLNMSWSSSNYCPSVITPTQERLWSHSSTAQNWAAISVLLQSCLGHRGALWARLLATGDDLSQNGKHPCSQPTTLDKTDHRVPPAFTDRTWQDLVINSVFPLSVNWEASLSVCVAAVAQLLCHQYSSDILLYVFFFIRSRWCNFLSSSESGQDKVLDKNQLAGHLAEVCEEKGKRSNPRCSHRPQLHSHGLIAPTFANEVACFREFPESISSVPTWWIFQTVSSKAVPQARCWTLMFLSLTPRWPNPRCMPGAAWGLCTGHGQHLTHCYLLLGTLLPKFVSASGICAA